MKNLFQQFQNYGRRLFRKLIAHAPKKLHPVFQNPVFPATLASVFFCVCAMLLTIAVHPHAAVPNPLTTLAQAAGANAAEDAGLYAGLPSAAPGKNTDSPSDSTVLDAPALTVTAGPLTASNASPAPSKAEAGETANPNYDPFFERGSNDDNVSVPMSSLPKSTKGAVSQGIATNAPADTTATEQPPAPENTPAPTDVPIPVITGEFEPNIQITGFNYAITVWGDDAYGVRLTDTHLTVTCQNQLIPASFSDTEKAYYLLPLTEGENEVKIELHDDYSNIVVYTFYVYCVPPQKETITISVEAGTLGLGYLIPPTEMEYEPDKPISYYTSKILAENGFEEVIDGTVENGYFLRAIKKPGAFANVRVPDALMQKLVENQLEYHAEFSSPDILGINDYVLRESGWLVCTRSREADTYSYITTGASNIQPQSGDHIRWRFTLANGKDIGGAAVVGGTNENWEQEW